MSLIERYKKTGGFKQLVALIETCGPKKRENFLNMIEKESPVWANAIRKKILDVERIFSWSDQTIEKIIDMLPQLTLAAAIKGLSPESVDRIFGKLTHLQKRKINELNDLNDPGPAEISASFVKIIEEVRSMINYGHIFLEKIDFELVIEDGIEEKLISSAKAEKLGQVLSEKEIEQITSNVETVNDNKLNNSSKEISELVIKLKNDNKILQAENEKLKFALKKSNNTLNSIKRLLSE